MPLVWKKMVIHTAAGNTYKYDVLAKRVHHSRTVALHTLNVSQDSNTKNCCRNVRICIINDFWYRNPGIHSVHKLWCTIIGTSLSKPHILSNGISRSVCIYVMYIILYINALHWTAPILQCVLRFRKYHHIRLLRLLRFCTCNAISVSTLYMWWHAHSHY